MFDTRFWHTKLRVLTSALQAGIVAVCGVMAGCQSQGERSDWHRRFTALESGDAIVFRVDGAPTDEPGNLPGTLTIQQATREALRCSPTIQTALAKVRSAEADSDQARLLPNPVFTLVVRFRHESPVVSPSIAEDLLAILKRPTAISVADYRLRAATASAVGVVLTVAAEIQETFLATRAIDDVLIVLAERKKLIDRLTVVAQSRLAAREGTRLDALTLEVQALQLQTTIADKELEKTQNRLALARLLGRPSGGTDWELQPWIPPAVVLNEAAYLKAAMQSRPEVQSKLWELSALGDEASLARWGSWEGLSVGGDAEHDLKWSGGPSVAIPLPLFDLGGARLDKAIAEVIAARHELADTRREVVESVRKAYNAYVGTQRQLAQMLDRLAPLQERRRDLAETAYKAGETDLTTLLLAEQDLQETREKLVELAEKAAVAYVTLQKSTGGARLDTPTTRPVR